MFSNGQFLAAFRGAGVGGAVGRPFVVVASPGRVAGRECFQQPGTFDEIRKQAAGFARFRAPGGRAIPGSLRRYGTAFEHPASKKGQCRFLHHFVQENGQLAAKIGNVFQFGEFEVAQGGIRAFAKIVHRRSVRPRHKLSPEAGAVVLCAPGPGRVAQHNNCARDICNMGNGDRESHGCSSSCATGRP